MKTHKRTPDSEILAFVIEHNGKMAVERMREALCCGRERLQQVAHSAGIVIQRYDPPRTGPKGPRNWATCKTEQEQRRALAKGSRDKWEEFMLFGPVRRSTYWQTPATNAIRDAIRRPPA